MEKSGNKRKEKKNTIPASRYSKSNRIYTPPNITIQLGFFSPNDLVKKGKVGERN